MGGETVNCTWIVKNIFRQLQGDAAKLLKALVGVCLGCSCFGFTINYLLPFLKNHGDLVLPFAAANGLTAAGWYAVLEQRYGLKFVAGAVRLDVFPQFMRPFLALFATEASNLRMAAVVAADAAATAGGTGAAAQPAMCLVRIYGPCRLVPVTYSR